jgi:hypothetical protein
MDIAKGAKVPTRNANIAQLAEHNLGTIEVTGSTPVISSTVEGLAEGWRRHLTANETRLNRPCGFDPRAFRHIIEPVGGLFSFGASNACIGLWW